MPPSLHRRILSNIEARLLSGDWPPGHKIPIERELMAHFGCSRMTVSKVLTQLVHAGLIERRRKAGSFVTRQPSQSAVLEIQDIKAEVLGLGLAYRHDIALRHKRRSNRADRDLLGLAAAGPVLDVVCHHFGGARPFCLEQRLINLAAVPEADAEGFATVSPGAWLVSRVPWSAAEHRIRASGADPVVAAALRLAEGTPCLMVERRTWSATRPITHVRLTYPGSQHELVARFTP